MPKAVTSSRPCVSRVRRAGTVRPQRRAASDATAITTPNSPEDEPERERHANDEQHRPERAENDDAHEVAESCEPSDVGPDLPAAHEPQDCEPAGEKERVQSHKPGERLHAHCGTLRIDTPSSSRQTTFAPDPYTVVSHP